MKHHKKARRWQGGGYFKQERVCVPVRCHCNETMEAMIMLTRSRENHILRDVFSPYSDSSNINIKVTLQLGVIPTRTANTAASLHVPFQTCPTPNAALI